MVDGDGVTSASEKDEANPICYAVFPWSWDWPISRIVYDSFFGLHRRYIFRVDLLCFLSATDVMAVNLCCKDAYAMYVDSRLPEEADKEWFEYPNDSDN